MTPAEAEAQHARHMGRERTKRELEIEVIRLKSQLEVIRRTGFLSSTTKISCELIRAVRVSAPWAFGFLMVNALAGRQTTASLTVESKSLTDAFLELATKNFSLFTFTLLALAFGVGGLIYGKRQERLRRDDVQNLAEYKAQYERLLDTHRSSSRITRRGETRPEDE